MSPLMSVHQRQIDLHFISHPSFQFFAFHHMFSLFWELVFFSGAYEDEKSTRCVTSTNWHVQVTNFSLESSNLLCDGCLKFCLLIFL